MTSGGATIMVSRLARMTRPLLDGVVPAAFADLAAPGKNSRAGPCACTSSSAPSSPSAARLADQRMRRQLAPRAAAGRAPTIVADVLDQLFARMIFSLASATAQAHRVTGVGEAVEELAALVHQTSRDPIAHHDPAEGR